MAEETVTSETVAEQAVSPEQGQESTASVTANEQVSASEQGEKETKSYKDLQAEFTRRSQENADLKRRLQELDKPKDILPPDEDEDLPPKFRKADEKSKAQYKEFRELYEFEAQRKSRQEQTRQGLIRNSFEEAKKEYPDLEKEVAQVAPIVQRLAGTMPPSKEHWIAALATLNLSKGEKMKQEAVEQYKKTLQNKDTSASLEKASSKGEIPADKPKSFKEATQRALKQHGIA